MTALHDFVQNYIGDLQKLLDTHSNDTALLTAVENAWQNENDPRHDFLFASQRWLSVSLIDSGGSENGEELRENVLVRGAKKE